MNMLEENVPQTTESEVIQVAEEKSLGDDFLSRIMEMSNESIITPTILGTVKEALGQLRSDVDTEKFPREKMQCLQSALQKWWNSNRASDEHLEQPTGTSNTSAMASQAVMHLMSNIHTMLSLRAKQKTSTGENSGTEITQSVSSLLGGYNGEDVLGMVDVLKNTKAYLTQEDQRQGNSMMAIKGIIESVLQTVTSHANGEKGRPVVEDFESLNDDPGGNDIEYPRMRGVYDDKRDRKSVNLINKKAGHRHPENESRRMKDERTQDTKEERTNERSAKANRIILRKPEKPKSMCMGYTTLESVIRQELFDVDEMFDTRREETNTPSNKQRSRRTNGDRCHSPCERSCYNVSVRQDKHTDDNIGDLLSTAIVKATRKHTGMDTGMPKKQYLSGMTNLAMAQLTENSLKRESDNVELHGSDLIKTVLVKILKDAFLSRISMENMNKIVETCVPDILPMFCKQTDGPLESDLQPWASDTELNRAVVSTIKGIIRDIHQDIVHLMKISPRLSGIKDGVTESPANNSRDSTPREVFGKICRDDAIGTPKKKKTHKLIPRSSKAEKGTSVNEDEEGKLHSDVGSYKTIDTQSLQNTESNHSGVTSVKSTRKESQPKPRRSKESVLPATWNKKSVADDKPTDDGQNVSSKTTTVEELTKMNVSEGNTPQQSRPRSLEWVAGSLLNTITELITDNVSMEHDIATAIQIKISEASTLLGSIIANIPTKDNSAILASGDGAMIQDGEAHQSDANKTSASKTYVTSSSPDINLTDSLNTITYSKLLHIVQDVVGQISDTASEGEVLSALSSAEFQTVFDKLLEDGAIPLNVAPRGASVGDHLSDQEKPPTKTMSDVKHRQAVEMIRAGKFRSLDLVNVLRDISSSNGDKRDSADDTVSPKDSNVAIQSLQDCTEQIRSETAVCSAQLIESADVCAMQILDATVSCADELKKEFSNIRDEIKKSLEEVYDSRKNSTASRGRIASQDKDVEESTFHNEAEYSLLGQRNSSPWLSKVNSVDSTKVEENDVQMENMGTSQRKSSTKLQVMDTSGTPLYIDGTTALQEGGERRISLPLPKTTAGGLIDKYPRPTSWSLRTRPVRGPDENAKPSMRTRSQYVRTEPPLPRARHSNKDSLWRLVLTKRDKAGNVPPNPETLSMGVPATTGKSASAYSKAFAGTSCISEGAAIANRQRDRKFSAPLSSDMRTTIDAMAMNKSTIPSNPVLDMNPVMNPVTSIGSGTHSDIMDYYSPQLSIVSNKDIIHAIDARDKARNYSSNNSDIGNSVIDTNHDDKARNCSYNNSDTGNSGMDTYDDGIVAIVGRTCYGNIMDNQHSETDPKSKRLLHDRKSREHAIDDLNNSNSIASQKPSYCHFTRRREVQTEKYYNNNLNMNGNVQHQGRLREKYRGDRKKTGKVQMQEIPPICETKHRATHEYDRVMTNKPAARMVWGTKNKYNTKNDSNVSMNQRKASVMAEQINGSSKKDMHSKEKYSTNIRRESTYILQQQHYLQQSTPISKRKYISSKIQRKKPVSLTNEKAEGVNKDTDGKAVVSPKSSLYNSMLKALSDKTKSRKGSSSKQVNIPIIGCKQ